MGDKKRGDVLKVVKERDIKFIRLWFTDVLGFLKGFTITQSELEGALEEGMGFDGSSIEGFARIEESDMVALPDPDTFVILALSEDEKPIACMFCDIQEPGGKPYEGDPRYALKRMLAKIGKKGYSYRLGPELEYFYFKGARDTEILDKGGYFDLAPLDLGERLRGETVSALERMGIGVEYSHHEVAPSQHEIDLRSDEALRMADTTMVHRLVVKEIAKQRGLYATFMPKPILGVNGSGMHTHQSLFSASGGKGDRNAFFDSKDPTHLSKIAKGFIAGLLRHAKEITAVTNQWVNSYKRLVPGYEAPVYISWARRNRSTLVRIPEYKPGKEMATRVELRSPDPACNSYLAFAVILAAGWEGVEKGYELPDPVEEDIFKMSEKEQKKRGIEMLPENLYAAIEEVERSELVRRALGDHIFYKFIDNKKIEWDNYRRHVSRYELERYLPIL